MRFSPPPFLVVLLATSLVAVATSRVAFSGEPALPTDGIDEPAPGLLVLPARITGPDGRDLVRSVALRLVREDEVDGIELVASYGHPNAGAGIRWEVQIHAFQHSGMAHAGLHALLSRPGSRRPRVSWDKVVERVHERRGILLRRVDRRRYAGHYVGVIRHSFVRVTPRRSAKSIDPVEPRIGDLELAGRTLALRAFRIVEEASPVAVRPATGASAKRVVVEHEFCQAEGRSRLVVRMTPGPEFGEGQARFQVFAGTRGAVAHASADTLRERPLAIIAFPKETDPGLESASDADPTGTTVRVLRIIEEDGLAIEEVRLVAGARGSEVIKDP